MIRSRERSNVVTRGFGPEYCTGPGQTVYYPAHWHPYTSSKETIVDDPKLSFIDAGRRRVKAFKAVTHTKLVASEPTTSASWDIGNGWICTTGCLRGCKEILSNPDPLDDQFDLALVAHEKGMAYLPSADTLANDRWIQARPTLRSRANFAVFLYELRDFTSLFDLLPKRHFNLQSWRDVLEYGNNQHLNYNFGWRPFISDLVSLVGGLSTFDQRLSEFVFKQDELMRRHAGTPEMGGTDTIVAQEGTSYVSFTTSWTAKLNSTFHFLYCVPEYQQREVRWRALLDTLGFHVTPSNIWAIIPWSFVWDWFFDVGRFLRQFEGDWLNPYVTWVQSCQSVSYRADTTVKLRADTMIQNPYVRVCDVRSDHYSRILGMPLFDGVSSDALNADKIRLLVSLAGARLL